MIINKMILKGYRRYSLTGIEKLTYTPGENIQIILGSNASGKSSSVREIIPLPSDLKKDFKEGGYKYIELIHNNDNYIVSSGYIGTNKHSFIINGEELNEVGLRKIQLQLVEEHFGLTPQIHEILLGNVNFTHMSVNDRKKWLTDISNIDYSYSIMVYNKLKQRHRDITGVIKITQNKLLQTDLKLLNSNDKNKLLEDLSMLNKLVDNLLENKTNIDSVDNNNHLEILTSVNIETTNILNKVNNYSEFSNKSIDNELVYIDTTISNSKNRIVTISKILDKVTAISDDVILNTDIKALDRSRDEVLLSIKNIENNNPIGLDLNNINSINTLYQYIYTDFISILSNISEHRNVNYTTNGYTELINKLDKLTSDKLRISSIIAKLEADKKVLDINKSKDKVECTNCNHSWHLNYNDTEYKLVIDKLEKHTSEYTSIDNSIIKLTDEMNELNLKNKYIQQARDMLSNNKELMIIFKYIIGNNDIQNDTEIILSNANSVSINLQALSRYSEHKTNLLDIDNKIDMYNRTIKMKQEYDNQNNVTLEKELSELIKEVQVLENTRSKYLVYKDNISKLESQYNKLSTGIKKYNRSYKSQVNRLRNHTINEMISYLKLSISDIEKRLHDSDIAEHRISSTKSELEEYIVREKVLRTAIKELSPTEGLIAKSINSFLNVFITEMNSIINSIWSFELRLLPCVVSEDNDLDYKFPVMINHDEIIDDVSKGSSSMLEIVNLAFKIVFMKYSGIINMPLVLDEFGKTMDPVHRINAFNTIEKVLSNNFPQIFVISHFESMYGQFSNLADISILSTDNLNIDSKIKYNEKLKIELK